MSEWIYCKDKPIPENKTFIISWTSFPDVRHVDTADFRNGRWVSDLTGEEFDGIVYAYRDIPDAAHFPEGDPLEDEIWSREDIPIDQYQIPRDL